MKLKSQLSIQSGRFAKEKEIMREHILIVDDDSGLVSTLKFLFEKDGYDVATSDDGRKALSYIIANSKGSKPVDFLITDIEMPNMNGFELIDELYKAGIHLPFIVLTGYGSQEVTVELLQKGCVDYFKKPFDGDELLKHVAAFLS